MLVSVGGKIFEEQIRREHSSLSFMEKVETKVHRRFLYSILVFAAGMCHT